ncbi:unnamed protein product [Pocillopora meandrina]|uniref:Peroxisomal 2,4-dienoyl-CoA reductase [(3E)-enoyl-CoA-producing] n=1 Tax=Pocillopora meandrina TaxID=46732 RepID=A0AAU9Y5G2_9CNID|nr:unnamed protein product [Pocillopora meandrina]
MYISLNFICNNEMRPFTLISLHFNHLEMKTMNSFESAFEPFSSEYCWGNCLDQCHAGSAKAAIEGMSRHLAVEWGPDGIRVDYVAPGAVKDTEGFVDKVANIFHQTSLRMYLYKDWFLAKMWQIKCILSG